MIVVVHGITMTIPRFKASGETASKTIGAEVRYCKVP